MAAALSSRDRSRRARSFSRIDQGSQPCPAGSFKGLPQRRPGKRAKSESLEHGARPVLSGERRDLHPIASRGASGWSGTTVQSAAHPALIDRSALEWRIGRSHQPEVRRYGLPAILVTHAPEDAPGGGPAHRLGTSLVDARLRLDPAALMTQTCEASRQAGWRGPGGSEMLPSRQPAKADHGEPDSGRVIGEAPASPPDP
jgi:hypothetical protein